MRLSCRLLLLLSLVLMPAQALAREILVVAPNTDSPLIVAFTDALREALPLDAIEVSDSDMPETTGVDIIITLGSEKLNWRLGLSSQIPSIATYVTQSNLPSTRLPNYQHVLLANPQPERQLRLAKLLLPRIHKVGVLYSDDQPALSTEWTQALANTAMEGKSVTISASNDLIRALQQLLSDSDVLMGTDDPAIYNADNLKTILLTSYSRSKVLIGPNAPFIDAGSLTTTYSTPEDMARSAAWLINRGLPQSGTSYPRFFSVLSNAQVARSLGIPLPDDATLARRLAELEQEP